MTVKITMRIREIRKAKGLTIAELSNISGVSIAHISEIETGKQQPTLHILCLIAIALDAGIEELFTYVVKK